MKRAPLHVLIVCLSCLAAAGCATSRASLVPDIGELRARAAASPGDAAAHRELALAEMFSYQGDPGRVDAAMKRALALDPGSARLQLMAGVHADTHGRPDEAFEAYLAALALASRGDGAPDGYLVEFAAHALSGLDGAIPRYRERLLPALSAALAQPGMAQPARYAVGSVLMAEAHSAGDTAALAATARALGCVTEMRIAGPFGPRDLLGFDRDHGVALDRPLADRYDLGPARGVRETRPLGARGCTVPLGGGPLAVGGTSYVQGQVDVARAGRHTLRLDTPNSVEIFVDGRSVLRVDRRRELTARVVHVPLELKAGRHRVALKLSTRHPSPVVSLSLLPSAPADERAIRLPFGPRPAAGYALYLRAAVAMIRGDVLAARETLAGLDGASRVSPHLLLHRSNLSLSDPLVPNDVRSDDARRLLGAALARDPELWNPTVQLATMAAESGRVKEAIEALRLARDKWPGVPAVGLTLVNLLQGKGWHAEADRVVAELRAQVPDACGPMHAELSVLRRRMREREAAELAEAIMGCQADANARYALLLRTRRWDAAARELDRLQAMDPPQNGFAWLLARAELAKNRGDRPGLMQQLAELRKRYPAAETGAIEVIDRQLAAGDAEVARRTLREALAAEPAHMTSLYRLAPVIGDEHVMAPYRKDGAEAIARYEAKSPDYSQPQVLVFDYMAARIFDDGSSVELVHTIQRAQSDEAVDELAEVQVPEGARVLKLRTIKPDGRRLEADDVGGSKETISMPSVASGDYVEMEYIVHKGPSEGFPDGYLGERFYFKSFEVPFDFSQMVIVLPESMAYEIDPRGPAPAVVDEAKDGLRKLTWTVENSEPLSPEPSSVAPREYIPSIRIGVRATWPAFVESIDDVLIDRDLADPAIARLVQTIVGDAPAGDHEARARRLYDWVLDNVDNNSDMFSQAAVMLRARAGNRSRVLHYLLGLAGVPSTMALARNAAGDATRSSMADGDTYDQLLVTVGDGPARLWLYTVERWAPFGYLPPALRGQTALLLKDGAPEVRLPAAREGEDRRTMLFEVTLRDDGSARIDASETVAGTAAIAWRNQLESVPEAEIDRRFEEEYVARLVPGASLSSVEIEGRGREHAALSLRYSFDVDVLGRKVSGGWALPPMLAARLAPNYATVSERTTEQLVLNAMDTVVRFRYHLPPGKRRPELPPKRRLSVPLETPVTFALDSRFDGDGLLIERRIEIPVMRIAPKDYARFSEFCHAVDEIEAEELVLGL